MANVEDFLRKSVEEVVRERLGSDHVVDVLVARDDDFEDDTLLSVTIVLDDADAELDEDEVLGLARHIRPRLAQYGETAFPVISFMTDQERMEAF